MSTRLQILALALIGFIAVVLATFTATGDIRPALAVGLFAAILTRIVVALRGLVPARQPVRAHRHYRGYGGRPVA
ncbi:hypothetical protein [Phenylobacterium deserti]|nr:hypothetical protein [Phenylobacterium deserti]